MLDDRSERYQRFPVYGLIFPTFVNFLRGFEKQNYKNYKKKYIIYQ